MQALATKDAGSREEEAAICNVFKLHIKELQEEHHKQLLELQQRLGVQLELRVRADAALRKQASCAVCAMRLLLCGLKPHIRCAMCLAD
jgi:hypothetical protein